MILLCLFCLFCVLQIAALDQYNVEPYLGAFMSYVHAELIVRNVEYLESIFQGLKEKPVVLWVENNSSQAICHFLELAVKTRWCTRRRVGMIKSEDAEGRKIPGVTTSKKGCLVEYALQALERNVFLLEQFSTQARIVAAKYSVLDEGRDGAVNGIIDKIDRDYLPRQVVPATAAARRWRWQPRRQGQSNHQRGGVVVEELEESDYEEQDEEGGDGFPNVIRRHRRRHACPFPDISDITPNEEDRKTTLKTLVRQMEHYAYDPKSKTYSGKKGGNVDDLATTVLLALGWQFSNPSVVQDFALPVPVQRDAFLRHHSTLLGKRFG